jgi:hypothetical protein
MKQLVLAILLLPLISGCNSLGRALGAGTGTPPLKTPESIGEYNSGFTYIPLDPLPVFTQRGEGCYWRSDEEGVSFKPLLQSLPDNAVRVAIRAYNAKGSASFGASSLGLENQRYQVILDYINVDVSNIPFYLRIKESQSNDSPTIVVDELVRIQAFSYDSELPKNEDDDKWREKALGNIVIPVYVGVGLRLTADVQVLGGNVNLSSLGAIAASVEAGEASGSLVVQTLGVTGNQVSVSLPLPAEMNQTTVQNAILALGSIKAIMNDEENTILTPRVTGIYLPMGNANEQLVNLIVSELAREPIPLYRPCQETEPDEDGGIPESGALGD